MCVRRIGQPEHLGAEGERGRLSAGKIGTDGGSGTVRGEHRTMRDEAQRPGTVGVVTLRQPPDVVIAEHRAAVAVSDAYLLVQDAALLVPRLQQPVRAEPGFRGEGGCCRESRAVVAKREQQQRVDE